MARLWLAVVLTSGMLQFCFSFNLDVENPAVFSGPEGSYFGFSVDFFKTANNQKSDVLVGAPRANTTEDSAVVERGAVYSCPWSSAACEQLHFDSTDNRKSAEGVQMEFKSRQWFGASVRSDGEHILACAPLYQWSTYSYAEREPVGTCFLKKGEAVVEYSPCRSTEASPEGQGFCQAGFSADFLKVCTPSQLISDDVSEVFTRFDQKNFKTSYANTLATKSASAQYDDSYLGYSVTVGDFNKDGREGKTALGFRVIFPSISLSLSLSLSQMAAYFGHSVVASDVNNDGTVDLLVGAPLFMGRGSDGKLREVGQVSVYLGRGGFSFRPAQTLTGSEIYARYGSAIAALGDLDMDGYNDVAVSSPYGGPKQHGLVYIHNGGPGGPSPSASQVLQGVWASSYMPASFGYAITGNTDIDRNGYPDLIVGVFGADKAVLYRARPVIGVNATLDITPQILNAEEKSCILPGTSTKVVHICVVYCLEAGGMGAPAILSFRVDLVLDRLKHKEATKRVLFLHSGAFQYAKNMSVSNRLGFACEELEAYLKDEGEFQDKITPISVVMEFSLDYKLAADSTGLLPILGMKAPSNLTKQAHILLDCGEDNICKPDLRLSVKSDRKQLYIGDDNELTLEISAENWGEGAYEAELRVFPPPQADYTTVVRSQALSRLSCNSKKDNETRVVVCELGNPMKGGAKVGHQLTHLPPRKLCGFSSNQFNNRSPLVSSRTNLTVLAKVNIRGASIPDQVLLPIADWKPRNPPVSGDDIGPQILHIYELRNSGPSAFSKAMLVVDWPYLYGNGSLLDIISYDVDGPINCTTDVEINTFNVSPGDRGNEGRQPNHVHKRALEEPRPQDHLQILDCTTASCLKLRCQVGRLERNQGATLFIYSRLAVNNFLRAENQNKSYTVRSSASFSVIEMPYKKLVSEMPSNSTTLSVSVLWLTDKPPPVPGWIVALAVLAGLLLLALLIFIMYKVGFFKRVRPPQEDCTEKEQLQPEENGNADA
uniref:Integrin alpha-2 domain-containing protein n=1 Tax=Gadus morhua TaxID=8049 RepID=A0A8C5FV77_GADMO